MSFDLNLGEAVALDGRPLTAWSRRALAAVDGERLVGRSFLTLSDGERQRVQLARVLAQVWEGKGFLLLDEPIVDLAHQHGLLAKLCELALSLNIGVLAVLHDLNLAAWYADRIGILKERPFGRFGAS